MKTWERNWKHVMRVYLFILIERFSAILERFQSRCYPHGFFFFFIFFFSLFIITKKVVKIPGDQVSNKADAPVRFPGGERKEKGSMEMEMEI